MKRFVLALALTATTAVAQDVLPPAPASPREAKLPQPVEKTLTNGLRVIVIPKRDVPLVSARLLVKTGSEEDPADMGGLAQLTASLLTQGTKTRSAEQIARGVEALGATLEASAGWDASQIDVSVMAPNFAKAMTFVGDVVLNPAFKEEEIERIRTQSIDSLQVALSDPASLAQFVAARVVYGESQYGHNVGGTPESLARIKRPVIVSFHSANYKPEDSVLVVGGDIDPAAAFSIAQTTFGTWKKRTGVMGSIGPSSTPRTDPPRVVVVDMPEAGQAAVVVTRRGLRRVDPLYYSALVTNSILGGGYSSRLNQEIRIKRGLSYGASSGFELRTDAGPFSATAQTKNESAAEVAALIVEELNRLGNTDIAETELTPRKAVLIGNFGRSLETSAGIVDRVSRLALFGLPLEEINRFVGGVQSVTATAVKDFARATLAGNSASIVIVGDAKKFVDALRQRFGSVDVIPATELDLNLAALRKMKAAA
jgi:zinc protease